MTPENTASSTHDRTELTLENAELLTKYADHLKHTRR